VENAISEYRQQKSVLIKMPGRQFHESGLVWIEKGKIKAYGFVSDEIQNQDFESLKSHLKSYYDTQDSQSILKTYSAKLVSKGLLTEGIELLSLS
jgi:hypothetical protein